MNDRRKLCNGDKWSVIQAVVSIKLFVSRDRKRNRVTHVSYLLAGFFKDLLVASKRGFHEMFKKTYGILYEQNAYVFTDFFKELENYYAKGTVSTFSSLPPFSLSEFDYLDVKMARLRFISLFAENSVYKGWIPIDLC